MIAQANHLTRKKVGSYELTMRFWTSKTSEACEQPGVKVSVEDLIEERKLIIADTELA
jgi:hypothetical protein